MLKLNYNKNINFNQLVFEIRQQNIDLLTSIIVDKIFITITKDLTPTEQEVVQQAINDHVPDVLFDSRSLDNERMSLQTFPIPR